MRCGARGGNLKRAAAALALASLLSFLWPHGFSTAQAPGAGQGVGQRYGGWPGAAQLAGQLNYRDLDGHWAAEMALRVSALGVFPGKGGYFRPQAVLTRREAMHGLLRIAGGNASRLGVAAGLPAGQGSADALLLNQAEQAGLLARGEREQVAAGLDKAVTRQEMAAWLARALDITPEGAAGPSFLNAFADAGQVREEYAGLIEALLERGLLGGRGRNLAPAAAMTRAEAAALVGRALPTLLASRGWRVTEGLILTRNESRDSQGLRLDYLFRTGAGEEWELAAGPGVGRLWAPDWLVVKGGRVGTSGLLAVGDAARVWLRAGQIVLVEVLPADQRRLTGVIETVSPQHSRLAVTVGGRREVFSLHPGAKVTVGGQVAALTDLLPGQRVSLAVRGGLVEEVAAELPVADLPAYRQPATRLLTGRLVARDGERLRVLLTDGREEVWDLAATTVLTAGGRLLTPEELQPGDLVRLTVEEGLPGRLVKLEVTRDYPRETLWYGRLVRVQPQDRVLVVAEARRLNYGRWLPPEDYRSFALTPEAVVYAGSRRLDPAELVAGGTGGQVFLTTRSGLGGEEVTWALIQEGEAWIYQDLVQEANSGRREIRLARGTVLEVAAGARLMRARRAVDLAGLSLAVPAQVVAAGGLAVFVEQEEYYSPSWRFYSGTLKEVRERGLVLDEWRLYTGDFWSEKSGDEREFPLAGAAAIIDGTGEMVRLLDTFSFLETRFTREFEGRQVSLVADGGGRVLALALRREPPGQEVTSLGTVAEVGQDGRLVLQDVLDWSTGYRGWRAIATPLRLDMTRALVFQDDRWVGPASLAAGDLIYVIHDYDQGLIAFRLPR